MPENSSAGPARLPRRVRNRGRRLLAMRAAFGLPYDTLLAYTKDPLGDLAEGRYDALADAALDDLGIRRPAQGQDAV